MPASSVGTLEGRAGASGEVGRLGKESAFDFRGDGRVLPGANPLDVHATRRREVRRTLPEVTIYPEVPALHSNAFLWLLDFLCGDCFIKTLKVPPISDVYAGLMKAGAAHRYVRKARAFLAAPELHRRTDFVEAVLPRRSAAAHGTEERAALPRSAARQGGAERLSRRGSEPSWGGGSRGPRAGGNRLRTKWALFRDRRVEACSERTPCGHCVTAEVPREDRPSPDAKFSLPLPCLSDVAPPSPSDRTKAVTVAAPCFSAEEPQSGPPTRVWTSFVSTMSSAAPLFPA